MRQAGVIAAGGVYALENMVERLAEDHAMTQRLAAKGQRVLVVDCAAARAPVYLKDGDNEKFYIRTGPATTELPAGQIVDYVKQRFGG